MDRKTQLTLLRTRFEPLVRYVLGVCAIFVRYGVVDPISGREGTIILVALGPDDFENVARAVQSMFDDCIDRKRLPGDPSPFRLWFRPGRSSDILRSLANEGGWQVLKPLERASLPS